MQGQAVCFPVGMPPMSWNSVKFEFWPEADRSMWDSLVKAGGLLNGCGRGAGWAEETRRVVARDYGYWLSFLLASDPAALAECPSVRVTPERVRRYCRSMDQVSARTRTCRIANLRAALRGEEPTKDFRWLGDMRRALERTARHEGPMRSKHGRLLPSGKLVEAGLSLVRSAQRDRKAPALTRARRYRDGLVIALLASRPLRIKNFADLRLGHHLVETSAGYLVDIPGPETKTGNPIVMTIPDDLHPWLREYLKVHRLLLLGASPSDHVWLTSTGRPYRPHNLSQRISTLTQRLVGVPISAHLFRDCAATTIATEDPEHVLIIAPLLGHTSLKTAENHYNHARSLEAGRRYQRSIKEARARLQPVRRRCVQE
jgi:integrase